MNRSRGRRCLWQKLMYDVKQRKTASSGEQDSGDINTTKGPLHAGSKTVELVKYMN